MSDEERARELAERKARKSPWHSPPHLKYQGFVSFIFTAACYEHAPIIGKTEERLAKCEKELLNICNKCEVKLYAWCVLPNHYHLLLRTDNIDEFKKQIGLFHGHSARRWNQEDNQPGRKVWFNFFERNMKSRRHLLASLNYVNHNPVHHRYVRFWQDWAFSSANVYLQSAGHEKAVQRWQKYPLFDYGKGWDE
ncbi:MAG: transposase [Pyrinomonadaceae bacterium]